MIAFGPIPSRRLGQSLGINHIPPKTCTFECVYCQVGPTPRKTLERQVFYRPEEIYDSVRQRVEQTLAAGGRIDYLTFVPDGEPTLDVHLGEAITLLRPLGIPVAVITNGTLLWRDDVRAELAAVDLVSVKVDTVDENTWHRLNRPPADLTLPVVLEGMRTFAAGYPGELITETMLVRSLNDDEAGLRATAAFLAGLQPAAAFLAVPTRPPYQAWVKPPDAAAFNRAYQLFAAHLPRVECLLGFSEEDFAVTGDAEQDLLGITAVHPMREREALDYLRRAGADAGVLTRLLADGRLKRVVHEGEIFFVRRFDAAFA